MPSVLFPIQNSISKAVANQTEMEKYIFGRSYLGSIPSVHIS